MEPRMMISVTDVLKAISDKKSFELFRIVALTKPDADILISKTKLTRKQYYSRMSSLMSAGLIKRKNGKHTLTAFGKVIYDITLTTIEKVVYNFIDNKEIKAVLVSDNKFESQPYAGAGQQQQKHLHQVKPELLVY